VKRYGRSGKILEVLVGAAVVGMEMGIQDGSICSARYRLLHGADEPMR
jgi:hypothetical protein